MQPKLKESWCKNLAGQSIGGYKLIEFLGNGKIGYVYKAEHLDVPGSERAIKLTFGLNAGWDTELRKVMALALIPNVVHFHDLGEGKITFNGESHLCQYTIWDYIDPGENLSNYLVRNKNVQTSFLMAVVERILHVLNAVHEKGVARHGDLHSGNILVGTPSAASLDDSLQPRAPIFVSDFGYGVTGGNPAPKDDYEGLAGIMNEIIERIEYATATAKQRQMLHAFKMELGKFLNEPPGPERRPPIDLLRTVREISNRIHLAEGENPVRVTSSVGQFQISEMIGDDWSWWNHLFVPTVPARSKILSVNIPTVVTGPRGCGKTMLFRRMSERLILECGKVPSFPIAEDIVAFYVNANDFADAFAHFPDNPSRADEMQLLSYANLCILAEVLTVQATRSSLKSDSPKKELLGSVRKWLVDPTSPLMQGEDELESYRTAIEQIKWKFPTEKANSATFPGFDAFSQTRWLPFFLERLPTLCPWVTGRAIQIFVDDYSTPRVSASMQKVLNRLFLQRSSHFLTRIATESSSTFIPEDSSGKNLQDGDDFQMVDIGEEALFLSDADRLDFLRQVFLRRLARDPRVPAHHASLLGILGQSGLSKREFARRLRDISPDDENNDGSHETQSSGRSRGRVHYCGEEIFADLWSGDTRTMIQLITDIVDGSSNDVLSTPVPDEIQDRVFRNRGGEWLDSHSRNEPSDPSRMRLGIEALRREKPSFALVGGGYGDHLKAVVEAFVSAARQLLLGPLFISGDNSIPRMAFRIEITDEFRLDGLAREVYRDLVRYGLFMRDSRGKSVRGAFVPRLYLRRLLLPFCTLALSKRDSVQMNCSTFTQLLLEPDVFKTRFNVRRAKHGDELDQIGLPFNTSRMPDPDYDDIGAP